MILLILADIIIDIIIEKNQIAQNLNTFLTNIVTDLEIPLTWYSDFAKNLFDNEADPIAIILEKYKNKQIKHKTTFFEAKMCLLRKFI